MMPVCNFFSIVTVLIFSRFWDEGPELRSQRKDAIEWGMGKHLFLAEKLFGPSSAKDFGQNGSGSGPRERDSMEIKAVCIVRWHFPFQAVLEVFGYFLSRRVFRDVTVSV